MVELHHKLLANDSYYQKLVSTNKDESYAYLLNAYRIHSLLGFI